MTDTLWGLILFASLLVAPVVDATPNPGTATAVVQRSVIAVPKSLGGVDMLAFGGLKADFAGGSARLRIGWERSRRGWIETWSLNLYTSGPEGEHSTTLRDVWPKAGHTYEARLDLASDLDAVSFRLLDVADGQEVYTALLHLPPSGGWDLVSPEETWEPIGLNAGIVLAEVTTVQGEPKLSGLPPSLRERLGLELVVAEEPARWSLNRSMVVGEEVSIRLAWPEGRIPGVLEVRVGEGDAARTLGAFEWSPSPVQVPIDLAMLGTGEHEVAVDYRFGEMRERVVTQRMTVYRGVMAVHLVSLRVPSGWSVTKGGVDWAFHQKDAIEGTLSVESADDVGACEVVLAVRRGDPGREVEISTTRQPLGGECNENPFSLPLPDEAGSVRLSVVALDPGVRLVHDEDVELRPTPVQWAVPNLTTPTGAVSLPTVEGVRHVPIFKAAPDTGTFNHHAQIFHHDGHFYASWSNHPRDEDAPGQRVLFALSSDGTDWTAAEELFPPNDHVGGSGEDGRYLTAQRHAYQTGFVATGDGVYAIATVMQWESGRRRKLGEIARAVEPDGTLGPIFWLLPNPPEPVLGFPAYPSSTDPQFAPQVAGIIRHAQPITWGAYALPAADGHSIVELTTYPRPDGLVVLLGRDAQNSRYMYGAVRRVGETTWPPLVRVNIPDSPSLTDSGVLPDGRVYLIHNPARARDPIVLSLSTDGIVFDRAWTIRAGAPALRFPGTWKTRGYQYPSSEVVGGELWVMYADGKEYIHVSVIPIQSLD